MFDPSSFFFGGGGGGVDYDPKKWGGKKKTGQTVPKSKDCSLAVGTYLQRDSAPPPPPPRGRRLIRGGRPAWEQGTMGCSLEGRDPRDICRCLWGTKDHPLCLMFGTPDYVKCIAQVYRRTNHCFGISIHVLLSMWNVSELDVLQCERSRNIGCIKETFTCIPCLSCGSHKLAKW